VKSSYQIKNSEFHLTAAQLRQLIAGARSLRDRLIVETFAYTGIRRAELRNLLLGDLDVESERIVIKRGKGGKTRIVFLPRRLADEIVSLPRPEGSLYAFPGRHGEGMSLRNINYIMNRVGRQSGVSTPNPRYVGVGPHLLRHSLARNWKRSGGSLESLQKILGHTSIKTTLDCYGTEDQREVEDNYRQRCAALVAE
jgi:integrase